MQDKRLTRRDFLRMGAVTAAGAALAGCAPKVLKETVVVEKPVEKVVKETVMVAGTPEVVEKVVTATPLPPEPVTIKLTTSYPLTNYDPVPGLIEDKGLGVVFEVDSTIKVGVDWAGYCDSVITRIAGGDHLDLIHIAINGMTPLAGKNIIIPLDDFLDADAEFKKDVEEDIHPALMKLMQWNGKQWVLPRGWNNNIIHYNYKMLEEKGVPEPSADWTWDDFLAACLAVADVQGTEDDVYAYAWYDWTFGWDPWFFNNGTSVLTDDWMDSNMLDPKVGETLQYLADLINVHKVAPVPGWNVWGEFVARHCVFRNCGGWCTSFYTGSEFFDYKFQYLPSNGGQYRTVIGADGECITRMGMHPEEAWEVMKILNSRELQMIHVTNMGGFPQSRVSVLESDEFLGVGGPAPADMSFFLTSLDYAKPTIAPPNYNVLEPLMTRWFTQLWAAEIGVEECVTGCHEEMQAEMDKMKEEFGF